MKIDYNKYINYIIVLYAFIIPLSRAGIVFLSALLIILWIINNKNNILDIIKDLKSKNLFIVLFLFILFNFISLFWSEHILYGLYNIKKYWYLLSIIVIYHSIKKDYIEYVLSSFLLGMMISEILSYGIFFELWSGFHGGPSDPTPFMNHLQYSMFLTFTSLLLLNRIFFEEKLKWKIFYSIYFLTVTSNLFLNGGRTGHLAFAVSIFVVGFLNIKNKIVAFFSMLILVVSIFYAAYHISPVFKTRFDASVHETQNISDNKSNQYRGSFGSRLALWIVGKDIISNNYIKGVGLGDEMPSLKEYLKEEKYSNMRHIEKLPNYHNYYVHVTVQMGIIGLILYLLIFYFILKIKIKDKKYSNLKVIFLSVYCVSSMVENMFHLQFSMAILILFTGLFLAINRVENKDKTKIML